MKVASSTSLWTLVYSYVVLVGTNGGHKFASAWQNSSTIGTCPPFAPPPFVIGDNPRTVFNDMGVTVTYDIEVPYVDWVSYKVSDWDCATPLPSAELPEDYVTNPPNYKDITAPILGRLVTTKVESTPDNDNDAVSKLQLQINPYHVNDVTTIYTEANRTGSAPSITSSGEAKICVRFSLWNGVPVSASSDNAVTSTTKSTTTEDVTEVNFLETNMVIDAKFTVDDESYLTSSGSSGRKLLEQLPAAGMTTTTTASFQNDLSSSSALRGNRRLTCSEEWGIVVFTCPSSVEPNTSVDANSADDSTPITQNDKVRLCVQPNAAALKDGVMLQDIRDLTYMVSSNPIVAQPGIDTTGVISSDGMTTKYCEDGSQLCIVETSLDKSFFDAAQDVTAVGTVKLQSSAITFYNALPVKFQLTFQVEQGSSSEVQSSAFSKSACFLLFAVAGLALAL